MIVNEAQIIINSTAISGFLKPVVITQDDKYSETVIGEDTSVTVQKNLKSIPYLITLPFEYESPFIAYVTNLRFLNITFVVLVKSKTRGYLFESDSCNVENIQDRNPLNKDPSVPVIVEVRANYGNETYGVI